MVLWYTMCRLSLLQESLFTFFCLQHKFIASFLFSGSASSHDVMKISFSRCLFLFSFERLPISYIFFATNKIELDAQHKDKAGFLVKGLETHRIRITSCFSFCCVHQWLFKMNSDALVFVFPSSFVQPFSLQSNAMGWWPQHRREDGM